MQYVVMRTPSCITLVLLCLLSGCQKPPLANQPSPLQIEMRHFEKLVPGCGDKERLVQPCFSFQVAYPEVTAAAAPEAVSRLNARILALMQPVGAPEGFEGEAERLAEQYQSKPRGAGSGEEEPAWFVRRTAEVIHATAAALAIRAERTEYLGGPSASSRFDCINLNPSSGAEYRLQDLLVPGSQDKLRTLVEARFRTERKIPADQGLSAAGYTFPEDRFLLPRQFLLVKRGIEFVFNPNEILKEGTGPVHLIVPWEDISSLIRQEIGIVPVP